MTLVTCARCKLVVARIMAAGEALGACPEHYAMALVKLAAEEDWPMALYEVADADVRKIERVIGWLEELRNHVKIPSIVKRYNGVIADSSRAALEHRERQRKWIHELEALAEKALRGDPHKKASRADRDARLAFMYALELETQRHEPPKHLDAIGAAHWNLGSSARSGLRSHPFSTGSAFPRVRRRYLRSGASINQGVSANSPESTRLGAVGRGSSIAVGGCNRSASV